MNTNCRTALVVILCNVFISCNPKATDSSAKRETLRSTDKSVDFIKYGLNDLSAAKSLKDILCQTWDNREDHEDNSTQLASTTLVMVTRGFSFFRDGTVIKNPRGDYSLGSWTLNDQKKPFTISMNFPGDATETYQLAMITARELTISDDNSGEKKLVDYIASGLSYKNISDDPFSPALNAWRIKPTAPESDVQIRNRLKSNIHFFVRFYDHHINTNATTVLISTLPSCYRWYAGGIFLYKENEIPVRWINCFYSKQQAMTAYKMADDLLAKKYTWPKGETNWLKQNVFVLRQMEQNL